MTVVKPHAQENYITNRMGIPAYDNIDMVYTDQILTSIIYSLNGIVKAQINYTYDINGDMINVNRIL
jgi:hypothetical protein